MRIINWILDLIVESIFYNGVTLMIMFILAAIGFTVTLTILISHIKII
jgi:hypothetical protein